MAFGVKPAGCTIGQSVSGSLDWREVQALFSLFPLLCAVRQSPEPVRLHAGVVVLLLPLPVRRGRGAAPEGGKQHRAVYPRPGH